MSSTSKPGCISTSSRGSKSAVAPVTQIAVATSFWYALLHYLVTPAVLAVLYFRAPQDYPRARNALLVGTLIGWPPTC